MGRPRKRRREDAADDPAVVLPYMNESDIPIHDFSVFGNFDTITPPQVLDSNCYISNNVNTTGSTLHQHLGSSAMFEVSPDTNFECDFYNKSYQIRADRF
jgi:hypothetical protein